MHAFGTPRPFSGEEIETSDSVGGRIEADFRGDRRM